MTFRLQYSRFYRLFPIYSIEAYSLSHETLVWHLYMIEIGKTHSLEIIKQVDFGVYLDGGDLGEILLPNNSLPQNTDKCEIGQFITVFLYLDSEDRPIATTTIPFAEVGDCAFLTVVEKSEFGSFLDWGLMKDLLVPFKEQRVPMEIGRSYVVYLYRIKRTGSPPVPISVDILRKKITINLKFARKWIF